MKKLSPIDLDFENRVRSSFERQKLINTLKGESVCEGRLIALRNEPETLVGMMQATMICIRKET